MAFYLISLGLDKNSISAEALEILKKCRKIYLEDYTVNFPYSIKELEKQLNLKTKIIQLSRQKVENESVIQESKNQNIALLVYGDALSATTHIQLILECKKQDIPYKIFHNASILTTVTETGLQLYKFGKTTTLPNWQEHTNKPVSFIKYIKENQSIKAHTLLLADIGLELKDALNQLEEAAKKENLNLPEKIIILSNVGTQKQKIFYDTVNNLKKQKVIMPFCIIILSDLHFLEEEALNIHKTPN